MFDRDSVKNIFYSGSFTHNYEKQLIVDIVFLIENEMLSVKKIDICSLEDYKEYIDKIKNYEVARIDVEGGSDSHIALKLIIQNFFLKNGYSRIACEQEYKGYFPDVSAFSGTDDMVLAECGNTNPDKIFSYFKNDSVSCLFVIPYPSANDTKIVGYIFRPGKELKEFLEFREAEMVRSVNKNR